MTVSISEIMIKTAVCMAAGTAAGFSAVRVFNGMPASWLCDYGRKPEGPLADPDVPRIEGKRWKWIYSAGFACACAIALIIGGAGLRDEAWPEAAAAQFAAAAAVAGWSLLIIGLADHKYMIIPDQFLFVVIAASLGFMRFFDGIGDQLAGFAAGAGIMLIVYLAGMRAYGRDVMGLGDVKLCAVLGTAAGLKGIIFIMAASSLLSGVSAAAGLISGRLKKGDMRPLGPYICGTGAFYIFIIWPFLL